MIAREDGYDEIICDLQDNREDLEALGQNVEEMIEANRKEFNIEPSFQIKQYLDWYDQTSTCRIYPPNGGYQSININEIYKFADNLIQEGLFDSDYRKVFVYVISRADRSLVAHKNKKFNEEMQKIKENSQQ